MSDDVVVRELRELRARVDALWKQEMVNTADRGVALVDMPNTFTMPQTIIANIAPVSGAQRALGVDMYAYNSSGTGTQWMGGFYRSYTVAGQTTVHQIGGVYTCLYHYAGYTLPDYRGIETGGMIVDGAGSVVTMGSGIVLNGPSCTNGGAVTTYACVYIPAWTYTGITNYYTILSERIWPSSFKGPIWICETSGVALDVYREAAPQSIQISSYYEAATPTSTLALRGARGTHTAPGDLLANDYFAGVDFWGYNNAAFRKMGQIQCRAAATQSTTSYPADMYFRLVPDGSTTPTVVMALCNSGCVAFGNFVNPTYRVDILAPAIAGSESILRIRVDDSSIDSFSIVNGTTGAGVFIPSFHTHRGSNNNVGTEYLCEILDSLDTGTASITSFYSRLISAPPTNTPSAVATRPTFQWFNHSTAQMSIMGSGSVCIGGATPNANAILDLISTTMAFMPPRMTTAQKTAIASPTAGMVVYDSTLNKLSLYTTAWETVSPFGNGTAQYQVVVTGATPFAPAYSGFLFDGTTGGKTVFAVTSTKVLTLTATDTAGLTVTGSASISNANTGDQTLAGLGGLPLAGGTINGPIKATVESFYGDAITLNDDTATSFTPASYFGLICINMESASTPTASGICVFRAHATTPFMTIIAQAGLIEVKTGALTGTTGTDGKLTLSTHTDGKIYIENRLGYARSFCYTLIGY